MERAVRETYLRPIYDKDSFSKGIAEEIDKMLYATIFAPLIAILYNNTRWASISLDTAFSTGTLRYDGMYVTGRFTPITRLEIKKLGGVWIKSKRGYRLSMTGLPAGVRTAIAKGQLRAKDQLHEVIRHLEKPREIVAINFADKFAKIVDDLSKQVKKTTPKDLEIPMELSEGMEQALREKYNLNLNLYIKDWSDQQIYRLREKVDENVAQGFRAEELMATIEAEYGVSKNKARFLAKQETSLLVSKYREERYTEAGINEYIWSSSHDDRVRTSHRDLDRKRFSWDSPPIVDPSSGRKAHPGEDFGCRCVAIPVLKTI